MKILLLILSSVLLPAQILTVDAGAPNDAYFLGGTSYASPQLRFGVQFSYNLPVPKGIYFVDLTFVEPVVTGPGQRVFNVTISGSSTPDLDVWSLAGGIKKSYTMRLIGISNGLMRIDFNTVVRSAVVSKIQVFPWVPSLVQSNLWSYSGHKECKLDGAPMIYLQDDYFFICVPDVSGPRWLQLPVQLRQVQ